MNHLGSVSTAYHLPFEVRLASGPVLSYGNVVQLLARAHPKGDSRLLTEILAAFVELAATGALAGSSLRPWISGAQIVPQPHGTRFSLANCLLDERAIVILAHLLLARQKELLVESLEVVSPSGAPTQKLPCNPEVPSTYPESYSYLPFLLTDEKPESGAFTFVADLRKPLDPRNGAYLEKALKHWTTVVLAGGYGLAPIPPEESYVEPDMETVTSFDTTVEWTVFKLRADSAAVHGVVNIFAAFHHRCQELVSFMMT